MQHLYHILSLDGGGVRALSSLIILKHFMDALIIRLEQTSAEPISRRPCDHFDLICGSGTGGILALFLGRLRMTTEEAIEAYTFLAEQTFLIQKWRPALLLLGIRWLAVSLWPCIVLALWISYFRVTADEAFHLLPIVADCVFQALQERSMPLFEGDRLADLLQRIVHDREEDKNASFKLLKGPKTLILASTDCIADAPPRRFRSYDTSTHAADYAPMWAVARASCATPRLFSPMIINKEPLIDAGICGYPNPTEVALDEAAAIWPTSQIGSVLSIGTGRQPIVSLTGTWSTISRTCLKLIESSSIIDDRLLQRFGAIFPQVYFRFDVDRGLTQEWMDVHGPDGIAGITAAYLRFASSGLRMKDCVARHCGGDDPIVSSIGSTETPLQLEKTPVVESTWHAGSVCMSGTPVPELIFPPVFMPHGPASSRSTPPVQLIVRDLQAKGLIHTETVTGAPPVYSPSFPLSTPNLEQHWKKDPTTPGTVRRAVVPTPHPMPMLMHKKDDKIKSNGTDPTGDNLAPTSPIHLLTKADVARMTFENTERLEMMVGILDDLLRTDSSVKRDPRDLVKALKLVQHCLFWGSANFVGYCQVRKTTFDRLCKHPVFQVRSRAEAVVNALRNNCHTQEERQIRASLMSLASTYLPLQDPYRTDSIAKAPPTDRRLSLEPRLDVSNYVTILGSFPIAGGGYGDVWKGFYVTPSEKLAVAIKFLRSYSIGQGTQQRRLHHESHVWRRLLHKNICPFYGIYMRVGMVSPFYDNGTLVDYLNRNPDINPLQVLQGVAEGVAYLHFNKIVHGDLRGANIMIDHEGTPKLIDFGLSETIDPFRVATWGANPCSGGSIGWAGPEVLLDRGRVLESDVYSFASTCIESITRRHPYTGLLDAEVVLRVLSGTTPSRPPLTDKWSPCDALWALLLACWRVTPQDRPNSLDVRRKLSEIYGTTADAAQVRPLRRIAQPCAKL